MAGSSPGWRVALATTMFAAPITVTFLDLFGYVAKVEGASMQVGTDLPATVFSSFV